MLGSPVEEVLFYDVSISAGSRRGEGLEGGTLPANVGRPIRRGHYGEVCYANVDSSIVWTIVHNEVPRLLEKSEAILEEEP